MARDRLDSMLAVDAFEKAEKAGYVIAKRVPKLTPDPKPLLAVVEKGGKYGVNCGTANIKLGDNQIPVSFERYSSRDSQNPSLRVTYKNTRITGGVGVTLEVCPSDFRLFAATPKDSPEPNLPEPDLPAGMLEVPGAETTLFNANDLHKLGATGRGRVRTQKFVLQRTDIRETTLLYRPIHDDHIIADPSSKEPAKIETVPDMPIRNLSHLSSRAAAVIAGELDPFIEIGSLDFYKPVAITPTHPLSQEVAHIIARVLYPKTE